MSLPLPPDQILTNGRILTRPPSTARAEAVAVSKGRIAAVGTNVEVLALKGEGTAVWDLQGRTVIPGLIDTHMHPIALGRVLGDVDLYHAASIAEIVERLSERAAHTPPDRAVVGRAACLDEAALAEGRLPTCQDLDRVSADRPVMIADVNKTIVNSAVLRQMDLAPGTPDPPHGRIGRDPRTGEPNGIFFFAAKSLTPLGAQSGSGEDLPPEQALIRAQEACLRVGLTSVIDGSASLEAIRAWQALQRSGELRLRATLMPPIRLLQRPRELEECGIAYGAREGRLSVGPLKIFFDPFVMHKTALMYDPYEGEPDNRGYATMEVGQLRGYLQQAVAARWPVGIHTTGDRGIDLVSESLADTLSQAGPLLGPSHLIHVYFPTEQALQRLGQWQVGVAAQPAFITAWGDSLLKFVGPARAARFLPLETLRCQGIVVGGGSDAPIAHYNPFLGIYAAVTRRMTSGRILGENERISREAALFLYTLGAAHLLGEANQRGSIEPGKDADLVVLDRDLFTIPEEEIPHVRVLWTVVGGEVVCAQEGGLRQ